MEDEEKYLDEVERRIASLSDEAFSAAYRETLEAGLNVLVAEKGVLYLVSPDGKRAKVRDLEAPTPSIKGETIAIR
jgi:hypothetical protein